MRRALMLGAAAVLLLVALGATGQGRSLLQQATFWRTESGAVNRTGIDKMREVLSVKDFGAVGDGTTDNATAFAAVATAANATSGLRIFFPDGTYKYSGGLAFTKPVTLFGGAGAVLNYTGTGLAVKMGADGLTIGTYDSNPYVVEGLTFTGGASSTQGIYFNTFITQPRVIGTNFQNFGSATGYAIFFQSQNWDARVSRVTMYAGDANKHNGIRANGIASDGTTSDQGQSRLTIHNLLASNQATATGEVVGIYTNGALSSISDSKIEGFSPNIWIGSNAGSSSYGTQIRNVYMEVVRGVNPCIRFGESAGAYTGNYTVAPLIVGNFCNTHQSDFGTTAAFIGPAGASSGLQNARVNANIASSVSAAGVLVTLNNLGSQTGNRARDNLIGNATPIPPSSTNPLHSAGGSITSWTDIDEANLTIQSPTNNSGFAGIDWIDPNGSFLGRIECSGSGAANRCTAKGPGLTNSFQFYNDGRFGLLRGFDTDSAGIKAKRGTAGCATGAAAGATCTTTVTWSTAFADANYTVTCTGAGITSGVPLAGGNTAKVAASVTFQTVAGTAAAAQYTAIDCIAVHD